jgi:hypothetical protein
MSGAVQRQVTKSIPGKRPARLRGGALQMLQKKAAFLRALAQRGILTDAEEATGIFRMQHHRWMQQDPEYAAAVEQAQQQAYDSLEREAWRRATEGTEEPVYQGGKLVGTKKVRSDVLLIFLMKGARPLKYRDNSPITNINASGPVQVNLNV